MKLLLASLLVVSSTVFAFAGANDITVDRPTNVFNTEVSASSSAMRAVRVGKISTVPSVVFNQPNYAPVILDAVDGAFRYNGVPITTDTFVGTDWAITQDGTVGRDLAVTRNETVGGTLGVTGATTLAALGATTGAFNSTLACATINTGHGANESYPMDQDVQTSASPTFTAVTSVGSITAGTNLIATAGYHKLYSRTFAEASAMDPSATGQMYYCSNCVSPVIVSTGAGVVGAFSGAGGEVFAAK